MSFEFDKKWLKNAIQLEDEANCDIQAGVDSGQDLDLYISKAKSYINCEKLTVISEESLDTIFQADEVEVTLLLKEVGVPT